MITWNPNNRFLGKNMKTTAISIDRVQINQVLTVLQQQGLRCPLEDVARLCPDLTDDQVFLAIDCLTRNGQVCLTLNANGTYLGPGVVLGERT